MPVKNNNFIKLWGMPILLAALSVIGLLSAIMGTGIWHIISWIALSVPIYCMLKYGSRYFK
jgi:hypothetical protein